MLELSVTTFGSRWSPTVVLQQPDNFSNLHDATVVVIGPELLEDKPVSNSKDGGAGGFYP